MDTRFLQSFIAVADHGSLAEAARRLDLTPAALALRIRVLEDEIGARLLSRTGRSMRLTAAGSAILARSRELVAAVADLGNLAKGDMLAGDLRLGAISTAITGILPNMLGRFSMLFPQIEIYISPGTSADLYDRVLAGALDTAIIIEPPFALPKTCDWQALRAEQLVVIAPAKNGGHDPDALLRSEPFIRYDRNHWGGRLADKYLRENKISPHERLELDALDAIAVFVDRGLGVSLVPDWAPPWPAGLSLLKLPVQSRDHIRNVGLVWRRHSTRERLVEAFLEVR